MSYDLALLHGIETLALRPGLPVQTTIGVAREDGAGELVTGLQELIQRFSALLLLERGSIACRPNDGADFMTKVRQGRLRTGMDVRQAFGSAVMDLRRQLARQVNDDDPPEQIFANATLISADVVNGRVLLSVKLTTAGGDTPKFILPIPTLPRS